MSLKFKTTKQFEKDILKMQKRDKKVKKLLDVMDILDILIEENPLDKKYKNHSLIGNYYNIMEWNAI
ncbi:MAG: type II toxin-antitoxin system mRNA interferase toxin, RelE/StbE family [bacterium]